MIRGKWPDFSKKRKQLAGYGFFGFFLCTTFFISAIFFTSVTNVIFLFCLYPVIILLFSARKKKRRWKEDALYTGIAILGVFLLVGFEGGAGKSIIGFVLAFLAGVFYAIAILITKSIREELSPEIHVLGASMYAVPFVLIMFLLFGNPTAYLHLPPIAWLYALGISLFCTFGGTFLMSYGVKAVDEVTAGLLLVTEPFFVVPVALLALGETPSVYSLLGGGFIILAAALSIRAEKKRIRVIVQ